MSEKKCRWCGETFIDAEMTWHGAPGADGRNSDECETLQLRRLARWLIEWNKAARRRDQYFELNDIVARAKFLTKEA